MVLIQFEKTSKPSVILLDKFYREPSDPPGAGKIALFSAIHALPSTVKTIKLDASGGRDEVNTRTRVQKWFTKDKRTFSKYTPEQIIQWCKQHKVPDGFVGVVLSGTIKEARRWLRVLASNEKLVEYYTKLGFKKDKDILLTTVPMRLKIN